MYDQLITSFILAFLVGLPLTKIAISLFTRLKILDDPTIHKHPGIIHTKPIPRGGGMPLLIAALTAFFLIPFSYQNLGIILASIIALGVGLYDDYLNSKAKDLSPYIRFVFNILCAVIIVASNIKINYITNPFDSVFYLNQVGIYISSFYISLADIVSIIWIVWVMNMLNWSKGVDGQMPGVVAISAIVIGLLSIKTGGSNFLTDSTIAFAIAGSAVAFLFFNFYPAKIFPGYGATSLYLLIAVVSMLSSAKLATAILVMGVPMVDAVFTIFRRILSGKSPFRHDNRHLHHILLKKGLSQRQIALSYWIFSAILGALSLLLNSKDKMFALIMLAVITFGFLLFMQYSSEEEHEKINT